MSDYATVADVLLAHRFSCVHEAELQQAIDTTLAAAGLNPRREVNLGGVGSRIDFVVDRVGLEVKVDGTPADVARQLVRYALSGELDDLVLVTTKIALTRAARLAAGMCTIPLHSIVLTSPF